MKNLKPITRQETLLAKVAGQDVPDLEPITREEFFLADVIEAIEGGGGEKPYFEVNIRYEYASDEYFFTVYDDETDTEIPLTYSMVEEVYANGQMLVGSWTINGTYNTVLSFYKDIDYDDDNNVVNYFSIAGDILFISYESSNTYLNRLHVSGEACENQPISYDGYIEQFTLTAKDTN